MKTKYWLLGILFLMMGLIVAACGGATEPQVIEKEVVVTATPDPDAAEAAAPAEDTGPIKVDFRLNWTLYGEHAPFFVGVEKGFYEEEGLDVEILIGSGSATTVKLIGNGTNVIGYADAGTMMRGVNTGVPVQAVAVLLQKSPMSVIYKAENPIANAEELVGKSIAITAGDANSQIFPAVLAKNGIDDGDVKMVVVGNPGAKETTLLEDQVDAFLGYYIDQPARMQDRTGQEMAWTTYTDMGINTLSSAIIVNQRTLDEQSDMVEKFLRGTVRAVAYTQENPEEAAEIFAKHAPDFDKELALLEIEGSLDLLHSENTEGKPIGWMAVEDWQNTQDVLAEYAGLKPEDDVNVYFTNDYLPGEEQP